MKKLILTITTLVATILQSTAAIGDWRIHLSYSEPQQIERVGELLFVRASNALYLYNKADQSIQTFDKTTGLNDVSIIMIGWNSDTKRLVIVYDNSNIDLMDLQGNVSNISDLYSKTMTEDKTVNSITMDGHYAYLATNFGGVKLDLNKVEISESYMLNLQVNKIGVDNDNIYARTAQNKTYKASLSSNLIDKSNWTQVTSWPQTIFANDNTAYEENIDLVKTLQPGGPKYNYFGFMKIHDNKLYTCNGGMWDAKKPASIQVLDIDKDEWTIFNNEGIGEKYGIRYTDILTLDIDPIDSKHVMAGSQSGLFEFYDGELINHYNHKNSPITFVPGIEGNPNYEIISSLYYTPTGDLYVANSHTKTPIYILDTNDKWITFSQSANISSSKNLKFMNIDKYNRLWVYSAYWENPAIYCYDYSTDSFKEYSHYVNQDGTPIGEYIHCQNMAEDLDGNIWVGLNYGLFLITEQYNMHNPEKGFYQIKVPRNDGTNYADYLLSGINITSIAVDNANRKWIGTDGNGVYLISSDNMVEEHHFTSTNSPLLSDIIQYIIIDNNTGIVYFGTEKGLCSYHSEATQTNEIMDNDNVWAFPNPVTPEFKGMITITGLSLNSDVKITTSNGVLVAEGRSTGGSFLWNGKDLRGNRVASGVYMVNAATSNGKKGTVCKVIIVN